MSTMNSKFMDIRTMLDSVESIAADESALRSLPAFDSNPNLLRIDTAETSLESQDMSTAGTLEKSFQSVDSVCDIKGLSAYQPCCGKTECDWCASGKCGNCQARSGLNAVAMWVCLIKEAEESVKAEPLISSVLRRTVLNNKTFGDGLAILLAEKFADEMVGYDMWHSVFREAFSGALGLYDLEYGTPADMAARDLEAIKERDPSCYDFLTGMIYFKGFKALQSHRAAHCLWKSGRRQAALMIQSRCAELWNTDIHPGSKIGPGLLIDHATSLVVGETAEVGRDCSFLHGVTLGSTGKECGDRHPKLGNDVLVGCNATILGNITVGDSAKIGSGSIVLKKVPRGATAVGIPAKIVGISQCACSGKEMDHGLQHVTTFAGTNFQETLASFDSGAVAFQQVDEGQKGLIDQEGAVKGLILKSGAAPPAAVMTPMFNWVDSDDDGQITVDEFVELCSMLGKFDPDLEDVEDKAPEQTPREAVAVKTDPAEGSQATGENGNEDSSQPPSLTTAATADSKSTPSRGSNSNSNSGSQPLSTRQARAKSDPLLPWPSMPLRLESPILAELPGAPAKQSADNEDSPGEILLAPVEFKKSVSQVWRDYLVSASMQGSGL